MTYKIGDYISYEYIKDVNIPGRILMLDEKNNKLKIEICIIDRKTDGAEKEIIECNFNKVFQLK